jgi:SAM-dependent MidA family methyltransferase
MQHNDTARSGQRELAFALDAAAAEQAIRVRDYLIEQIGAAGGWLSFERFMDLALYAPGLGYYSGGARKLGRDGDFTTAPEISSLFGACVAVQCAQVLSQLAGGMLMEVGAGSGRLAVDILSRLEALGELPASYGILEVSADLRDRQRRRIAEAVPHLLNRVHWFDDLPAQDFDGLLIANEVLDALPVARFRWLGREGVEEMGVVIEDGAFAWGAHPAPDLMAAECRRLAESVGGWDEGYISEYCPRLAAWTRAVTGRMQRGAVLWLDYGLPRSQYYLPQRHEGTLVCHFRHRAHDDVFFAPGLQDLSAWVDFTALAEASREAGFALAGFTTQAHFLAGTGIDREMQAMTEAVQGDANHFARLANQARQLMLPGEMGERFKAMAWLKGMDLELTGFQLLDLRHTLG